MAVGLADLLEELQNAPPGTVFKERRGAPLYGMSLGGIPAGTPEFRATYRALPPGSKHQTTADTQARLAANEEQSRELDRLAELLEG